jgi:putative addiction module antidote
MKPLKVKVTTVGNSTGIVLPKEALAKLRVVKGDSVHLTETPTGYQVTAFDPEFDHDLEIAEGVMRKYRNALRRLAK